MAEAKQSNGLSRRDFLKIGGLAGAALTVGGTAGAAYAAGKDYDSYTGWESFEGTTQFFDRKPYEFDGPAYTPVGETRRASKLTEFVFARVGYLHHMFMEGWTPEDGIEALGEPYTSFYKEDPEAFELDMERETKIMPEAMQNHAKYDEYFALAEAYSIGWENLFSFYPAEPTEPPEISDYQLTRAGLAGPEVVPIREPLPFKSPDHASKLIKKMAHLYGATMVGIARLNPDYVFQYNIRGGEPGPYEVPSHWEYAIVVGVPQEWDQVLANPAHGTSYDGYNRVRNCSGRLAAFVKALGYPARSHHPPDKYDLVVPPITVDAGLGQLGRHGFVITPETGGSFRTAVVTTNLPMTVDKPIDFGVAEFCKTCKICAEQCPSGAISLADSPEDLPPLRGYQHWYINTTKCFNFWMQAMGPLGCRLCIATCPYSRKNNWVHDMSRTVDANDPTGMANDALVWMQRSFFKAPEAHEYMPPPEGRFAGYRPAPEWLEIENYFDVDVVNPQIGA
jgi:reductive dehalogenase